MQMAKAVQHDPDLLVVEALRQGDAEALREFMRRHERWVRGVILGVTGRSDLVSEIAQDVWMTVWQQIGSLREPAKWRSWLYQLTRRAAIDASKKRKRRTSREVDGDAMPFVAPDTDSRPEGRLIADERHERVMEAIQSLPPHYREPFVLKHLEEWSYAEIAEMLEMPVDTVETRLVRARRMLRETLQGLS